MLLIVGDGNLNTAKPISKLKVAVR